LEKIQFNRLEMTSFFKTIFFLFSLCYSTVVVLGAQREDVPEEYDPNSSGYTEECVQTPNSLVPSQSGCTPVQKRESDGQLFFPVLNGGILPGPKYVLTGGHPARILS